MAESTEYDKWDKQYGGVPSMGFGVHMIYIAV